MPKYRWISATYIAAILTSPVLAQSQSAEVIFFSIKPAEHAGIDGAPKETTLRMRPSVITSTLSPYGTGPQIIETVSECIQFPSGTVAPNCDITIDWSARNASGGHVHNADRPPGIFATENGVRAGSTTPGPPASISDNSGPTGTLGVTYTAPESGGITDLMVSGVATVDGKVTQFGPNSFTIGVAVDGLQRAVVPGMQVNAASNMHGNNNGHALPAMAAALSRVTQRFSSELKQRGLPVRDVRATALSLPLGGLFDFRTQWQKPHASHRFGDDADIGIREFNRLEREALAEAILASGFTIPVRAESPSDPQATHWHIRLRQN